MGYSIRQLADEFGVSLRTIRFYEQRGLVQASRTSKFATAPRVYSEEQKARLAEILDLTKMGFTLTEIGAGEISPAQYEQQLSFCLTKISELEASVALIRKRLATLRSD